MRHFVKRRISAATLLSLALIMSAWSGVVMAQGDGEKNYFVTLEGLYLQRDSSGSDVWVFNDNGTTTSAPSVALDARADDQVISTSDDLDQSWEPGVRLTVGGDLGAKPWGFEASGFWIAEHQDSSDIVSEAGDLGLFVDFFPSLFSDPSFFTDEFDGANQATARYSSQFWNAEANATYALRPNVTVLFGARYMNLDESFDIEFRDGLPSDDLGQYFIDADNHLIGLQVGAMGHVPVTDSIGLRVTAKAGPFANFASQDQILRDDVGSALERLVRDTGEDSVRPAVMGEVNIAVEYAPTPSLVIGAGYEFMAIHGVALASAQIDAVCEPSCETAGRGLDHNETVWWHGPKIFATFRF